MKPNIQCCVAMFAMFPYTPEIIFKITRRESFVELSVIVPSFRGKT